MDKYMVRWNINNSMKGMILLSIYGFMIFNAIDHYVGNWGSIPYGIVWLFLVALYSMAIVNGATQKKRSLILTSCIADMLQGLSLCILGVVFILMTIVSFHYVLELMANASADKYYVISIVKILPTVVFIGCMYIGILLCAHGTSRLLGCTEEYPYGYMYVDDAYVIPSIRKKRVDAQNY